MVSRILKTQSDLVEQKKLQLKLSIYADSQGFIVTTLGYSFRGFFPSRPTSLYGRPSLLLTANRGPRCYCH